MSLAERLSPHEAQAGGILRARARALARRPAQEEPGDARQLSMEVLEFRLAAERYAVETMFVQEVHALKNLTALPCTPAFVSGIVNLRGHIVAVVNLKKFFNLPEQGLTDLHRIILVGNGDVEFGLLADASVGVRRIARASLQPPLPTASGIGARYVQGISADSMLVLDMARILADPRILVNEEPDSGNQTHNP